VHLSEEEFEEYYKIFSEAYDKAVKDYEKLLSM
jgi:hypothetical protein